MSCAPPDPNPDVSGIGVRVSFYLQSVLLCASPAARFTHRRDPIFPAVLAARSASADEITDALSTLIVTNLAMCVTTMVQALENDLTLYEYVFSVGLERPF
jgi:hypothetical protein